MLACRTSAAACAVRPAAAAHHLWGVFERKFTKMQALQAQDLNRAVTDGAPLKKQRMEPLRVQLVHPDAKLPKRGSADAAGYDLSSCVDTIVPARGVTAVPTGLIIAVPSGTYGRVAPRSGLAIKNSINTGAGVVDADYRGEVGVVLFNHSDKDFHIKVGDRIAQLVLECIVTPEVEAVTELSTTERGAGGFGSTGVQVPL